MRLRNIPRAEEIIKRSSFYTGDAKVSKGSWNKTFSNNNPIYVEIGMGKGQFIVNLAKQNPNINYIGIEKYSSVLVRAIQKLEDSHLTLSNIKFLCMDAKELEEVFAEEEIDKIYLNFSDPWPKERHARRRLPSKEFLARYAKVLSLDGDLEFKTDNRHLFDFAVEELALTKWEMKAITYDLHNDIIMVQGNVMTEYEEKFSAKGNPIHKYVIAQ